MVKRRKHFFPNGVATGVASPQFGGPWPTPLGSGPGHLTLIFNCKVKNNTFFEKAKNKFLYVSNDERISIVNDKKDKPIEQ